MPTTGSLNRASSAAMITSATHSSISPPAIVLPWAAASTGLGRLRHRQHIWKYSSSSHAKCPSWPSAENPPLGVTSGNSRKLSWSRRSWPLLKCGPSACSTITFTSLRRAASSKAAFIS